MTYGETVQRIISELESVEVRLKALRDNSGELSRPKIDRVLQIINALIQELNALMITLIHDNLINEEVSE